MAMKNLLSLVLLCAAVSVIAACSDHAATSEAAHASASLAVAASAASKPVPPPAAFTVGSLAENDGDGELQGCTTGLTVTGAAPESGDTFRESSTDTEGVGFIRIDGALVRVTLLHSDSREHGVTSVFEDAAHTLRVIESVESGETNENTDSTSLSGTLTITYKGVTQTLRVEGGVAC
nr:hypothetical protein [Dyella sp. ASV24]